MKVEYSPEAERDLDAIADYVADESGEGTAVKLIARLIEACEKLGPRPKAYPLIAALAHLEMRRRVVGSYLVFYRVTKIVQIVRVVHGARDYLSLLEPDD